MPVIFNMNSRKLIVMFIMFKRIGDLFIEIYYYCFYAMKNSFCHLCEEKKLKTKGKTKNLNQSKFYGRIFAQQWQKLKLEKYKCKNFTRVDITTVYFIVLPQWIDLLLCIPLRVLFRKSIPKAI